MYNLTVKVHKSTSEKYGRLAVCTAEFQNIDAAKLLEITCDFLMVGKISNQRISFSSKKL